MFVILSNIYATKGAEYVFEVLFVCLFLGFLFLASTLLPQQLKQNIKTIKEDFLSWFRLPVGYWFHQGHSWMNFTQDQARTVFIGIDDFAQKLLGTIEKIEFTKPGRKIKQGQPALSLTVENRHFNLLSPVTGKVIAINHSAIQNPQLIREDPYKQGWILKVRVDGIKRNLAHLLDETLAPFWLETEINHLKSRMGNEALGAMQDGGLPVDGMAKSISPDHWDELVNEFLLTSPPGKTVEKNQRR